MFKILVVEDTLVIREELTDILSLEGYQVFEADNGNIGFDVALKEAPNLIISDILMPELDGFGMYKKLQTHNKTRIIPLIFLSAKAETEDITTGLNLGAKNYLTKPININILLNTIKTEEY
ncbi:response regulator transcription factor [Polaribacter irgensii]|nr:response regulator [Polaribacter irgensii]